MKRIGLALLVVVSLGMGILASSSADDTSTRSRGPVPPSLFGLTVKNSKVTPAIAFGTARSWDTWPHPSWSDLNPAPGVYRFKALDDFMAANTGRDMIYTLGRTPQWASSQPNAHTDYGPGQCAPPTNMDDWDNYLRAVVTHAAGKIKYWEIWNEPQNRKYYCGDISTIVTLAQHANQIIKTIDPSAQIISPSPTSVDGPAWLAKFLSQGGAKTVDIIAFHGYPPAGDESIVQVIAKYKSVMTANGVGNLPMWDTESCGGITPAGQIAFLAKYYLLEWSYGVSRFLWYAYDDVNGRPLWIEATGPNALGTAYVQTSAWMVGASLTKPCSKDSNALWTCELSRPSGYQAEAIWNPDFPETVTVSSRFKDFRDLSGVVHPIRNGQVSVANEPVLLETRPLKTEQNIP